MKSSVYEQFATVREDSASLFDARLNEKVLELREYNPRVKFSESIPFYAHITYTVNEKIPETISEASEMAGVRFVCGQCPNYKPMKTADGEIDKRCRYGDCDLAKFDRNKLGRTKASSPACDELYELIKEGSVKLCFAD